MPLTYSVQCFTEMMLQMLHERGLLPHDRNILQQLQCPGAVVGYAAAHLNRWHVDRELLLRALALYTLFNAVVNLVTRRGFYDKARLPPPRRASARTGAAGHAVSANSTLYVLLCLV